MAKPPELNTAQKNEKRAQIADFVEAHVQATGSFPTVRAVKRSIEGNGQDISDIVGELRREHEDRLSFERERQYPDWVLQSGKDIYRRAQRQFAPQLESLRLVLEAQARKHEEHLRRARAEIDALMEQLAVSTEREQQVTAERDRLLVERDDARQDCALLRMDIARHGAEQAKATGGPTESDRQARRAKRPMAPKLQKARLARRRPRT